jgi:hypothetical protein
MGTIAWSTLAILTCSPTIDINIFEMGTIDINIFEMGKTKLRHLKGLMFKMGKTSLRHILMGKMSLELQNYYPKAHF